MSSAIHHGPPGSFKSFTLIQRFAIQALVEGRTVVTNVRGFDDLQLVIEQFPEFEFPDTANIIHVDCRTKKARDFMARWFHWVPFGALIIIDEVQQIYPNRRDFKMESLDYFNPEPGQVIDQLPEPRPEDIFVAFEKQRHYNWDIYLSTPNIAKVKKEIREVADWGYRHRNLTGVLPWKKDCWMEHQHDPEFSGKSLSHVVGSPTEYKADPRVYKCYKSTATGEHTENKAGRSVFSDRKVLSLLVVIACCLVTFFGLLIYKFTADDSGEIYTDSIQDDRGQAVDHAPIVPAVRIPVQVVNRTGQLGQGGITAADYRIWSFKGVAVEDFSRLPGTCSIFHNHVTCPVPVTATDLIKASKNNYCANGTCFVVFAVFTPVPASGSEADSSTRSLGLL